MDASQVEAARVNYQKWKAEFEIFLFVGAEERNEVADYPNEVLWTEYVDFDTFYLVKGFDGDPNRRLPVTGWYVGKRNWQGNHLEYANVLTAATVTCQSCEGTGETFNGNVCAKCAGDGGTLIEFEGNAE